jgi:hypothetical protein
MGVLPERFLSVSQSVCHALEVLGYVIDTYDKVRQEVEGEQ